MARTTGLSSQIKSTVLYGFAVHLSVGFLVAFIISMVHVEKAQADHRAKLVKAYDESVETWLAGDAETYARKWTGEEALPLPSVSLEREDPERPQSSVVFDVLQSGPEATGSLRDDEPDYKRYDEGTMLVAILEGFHDESFHTGVEDVVFTVGNTSVTVKAMTCVVNEHCQSGTEEDAEDSNSDERDCSFTIAHAFLQSVRLVDLTGDADAFLGVEARASTCALEYNTNHGTDGTGDWFASRDAAIQECAVASVTFLAPDARRDVRVSIRSPSDPFVTAMELTYDSSEGRCSLDFGMTPEELRKVALDAGIAAGVLFPAAAAAWAAGTHFLRKQNAERRSRQYSKETPAGAARRGGAAPAPVSAAVAQQPPSAYGGMPATPAMPQPHGPPAAYGGQSAPATYNTRSTFASIFGRAVQTR